MALPRLRHSTPQLRAPSTATLAALESALSSFRISPASTPLTARRNASHQAQGRANKAKQGPGKRLGAKKGAGQYVVPGNILFKQRGTDWFAGDGCFMARDHSIHAQVPGYVKFYRDPALHPKRKYIGVVFERNNPLPQPHNAARKRMLGMLAYQMPSTASIEETGDLTTLSSDLPANSAAAIDDDVRDPTVIRELPQEERQTTRVIKTKREDGQIEELKLTLRPGGQWRQPNWEIGRINDGSQKTGSKYNFKPGDRWLAWRKRTARRARAAERRAMGRGGKAKHAGKNQKQRQKN